MRLLQFTDTGGKDIYIVDQHIAAVQALERGGCDIYLAVGREDSSRPVRFQVQDDIESVVSRLRMPSTS